GSAAAISVISLAAIGRRDLVIGWPSRGDHGSKRGATGRSSANTRAANDLRDASRPRTGRGDRRWPGLGRSDGVFRAIGTTTSLYRAPGSLGWERVRCGRILLTASEIVCHVRLGCVRHRGGPPSATDTSQGGGDAISR